MPHYHFDLRMSRENENGTYSTATRQLFVQGKLSSADPIAALIDMIEVVKDSPLAPEASDVVVTRGRFASFNSDRS